MPNFDSANQDKVHISVLYQMVHSKLMASLANVTRDQLAAIASEINQKNIERNRVGEACEQGKTSAATCTNQRSSPSKTRHPCSPSSQRPSDMARKKRKDVNARIDQQPNGLFCIVNDDSGEPMGTDFPTREAAEQSALDHDCYIVTNY